MNYNLTKTILRRRYVIKTINNEVNANAHVRELRNNNWSVICHTKLNGKFALRIVIGQTNVDQGHVNKAIEFITLNAKDNG